MKKIEGDFIMDAVQVQVANQRFMPLGAPRALEADELDQVFEHSQKLFHKFKPGYDTPIAHLLSSPSKGAALSGLSAGGLLGSAAGLFTRLLKKQDWHRGQRIGDAYHPFNPKQALAIGVGLGATVGIFAGVRTYLRRRKRNEDYLDIMSRLPPGANYRDYLSDPAVQAEIERQQAARAAAAASSSYYPYWGSSFGSGFGSSFGSGSSSSGSSGGGGFSGSTYSFGW